MFILIYPIVVSQCLHIFVYLMLNILPPAHNLDSQMHPGAACRILRAITCRRLIKERMQLQNVGVLHRECLHPKPGFWLKSTNQDYV